MPLDNPQSSLPPAPLWNITYPEGGIRQEPAQAPYTVAPSQFYDASRVQIPADRAANRNGNIWGGNYTEPIPPQFVEQRVIGSAEEARAAVLRGFQLSPENNLLMAYRDRRSQDAAWEQAIEAQVQRRRADPAAAAARDRAILTASPMQYVPSRRAIDMAAARDYAIEVSGEVGTEHWNQIYQEELARRAARADVEDLVYRRRLDPAMFHQQQPDLRIEPLSGGGEGFSNVEAFQEESMRQLLNASGIPPGMYPDSGATFSNSAAALAAFEARNARLRIEMEAAARMAAEQAVGQSLSFAAPPADARNIAGEAAMRDFIYGEDCRILRAMQIASEEPRRTFQQEFRAAPYEAPQPLGEPYAPPAPGPSDRVTLSARLADLFERMEVRRQREAEMPGVFPQTRQVARSDQTPPATSAALLEYVRRMQADWNAQFPGTQDPAYAQGPYLRRDTYPMADPYEPTPEVRARVAQRLRDMHEQSLSEHALYTPDCADEWEPVSAALPGRTRCLS